MFIFDDIANAVAAGNAAAAQERQAREAMQLQRDIYNQNRQDMMPWLNAGQTTLADLMSQMRSGSFDQHFDPSQIANDPGYQFRMAEGQKALERSAAARGGLNSGGFMKGLSRYSQGLASDEFQNAWNRNQAENTGRYNRLAALSGVGQTAANSLGALGGNYANSMGNLYGALGNAQSAGAMGVGKGIGGAFGSLGGLALAGFGPGGLAGGWSMGNMANNMFRPQGQIPTQGGGWPYGSY